MKHFPDEAWLDFARRVLPQEEISHMRAHLDSGCRRCSESHDLWTAVSAAAGREPDYTPDEAIVTVAKTAFAGRSWRLLPPQKTSSLALVFDSLLTAGAAAGLRSISTTARHLLYQSGPLAVDLRLDAPDGNSMMIAGQVLGAGTDPASGRRWDVTLLRGSTAVARTSANDFGEFQFDCENGPDLRIRMEMEGQQPFTLTLPD
jgi:hypothetical protein